MKNLILFALFALFFVTGCTPTNMQKAKQDFVCKDKGGVYLYARFTIGYAECKNGELVDNWNSMIITEEFYPENPQND